MESQSPAQLGGQILNPEWCLLLFLSGLGIFLGFLLLRVLRFMLSPSTFSFSAVMHFCCSSSCFCGSMLPFFTVSLLFFVFILSCLYPQRNPRETLDEAQRHRNTLKKSQQEIRHKWNLLIPDTLNETLKKLWMKSQWHLKRTFKKSSMKPERNRKDTLNRPEMKP